MIGSDVVEEIWAVLHDHKPFDRARFIALLEQLGSNISRNAVRSKYGGVFRTPSGRSMKAVLLKMEKFFSEVAEQPF